MSKLLEIYDNISYDELYNICSNSKSKSEIFRKLKLSDNSSNWNLFKKLLDKHNINLEILLTKQKEKLYCLHCGKEITKHGTKFCCLSCAVSYNNKKRKKKDTDKQVNVLDNGLVNHEKKKYYCLYCGKELSCNKKFCDDVCAGAYRKNELFNYYMNNQEEFCRSNFVPRHYIRERILENLKHTCSICGCAMKHNNKPLVFVLDHIDGDASNNHFDNLRMVCPNCDSLLPTFKSKNKNSARRDYFREHIKELVILLIKDGSIII